MSMENECNCDEPVPRKAGVHPTSCIRCEGVME